MRKNFQQILSFSEILNICVTPDSCDSFRASCGSKDIKVWPGIVASNVGSCQYKRN